MRRTQLFLVHYHQYWDYVLIFIVYFKLTLHFHGSACHTLYSKIGNRTFPAFINHWWEMRSHYCDCVCTHSFIFSPFLQIVFLLSASVLRETALDTSGCSSQIRDECVLHMFIFFPSESCSAVCYLAHVVQCVSPCRSESHCACVREIKQKTKKFWSEEKERDQRLWLSKTLYQKWGWKALPPLSILLSPHRRPWGE